MTANMIDGKAIADKLNDELKDKIAGLKSESKPGLAVVLVGDEPASVTYTDMKVKKCEEVGVYSEMHKLDKNTDEEGLLQLIYNLNSDENIHGILVQLPMPKHIDENKIISAIRPEKDVDGFHPLNMGRLVAGDPYMVACTPLGCMKLIESTGTKLQGKDTVVVGKSNIVGKPMAHLLMNKEATVTVCHILTKHLKKHTKEADILVVAAGSPGLIRKDMVKQGAVVIDVGTNKVEGKYVGDVLFDEVKDVAGYITPVPGGVGPMTIACLLANTYEAFLKQENLQG